MIVEYAALVSAMALLTSTLGGAYGPNVAAVFGSGSAGVAAAAQAARSERVSVPGAREAYKRAPYRKPALKYLFVMGWIGGVRNKAQCALTTITQDAARSQARRSIERDGKLRAQLRKRRVSVKVAAAALVKGVVSACPEAR